MFPLSHLLNLFHRLEGFRRKHIMRSLGHRQIYLVPLSFTRKTEPVARFAYI